MQLLEKTFKLKEHKTTVLTEVVGGITTFFAMAYIIFVNPNFLSQTGMDHTAVMLATCISAAIGSLLTAFLANVPFAQAPGMGLNAFFTYTICFGMGYTWQQGLAIVFISGLIFLAVTVSPLRSKIIASIPASLKAAISAGIGLFICLIGLLNAGIVTAGNNLLDLSNITTGAPLLALIGLLPLLLWAGWCIPPSGWDAPARVLWWFVLLGGLVCLTGLAGQMDWAHLLTADAVQLARWPRVPLYAEYLFWPLLAGYEEPRSMSWLPWLTFLAQAGLTAGMCLVFGAADYPEQELLRAWSADVFSRMDALLLLIWLTCAIFRIGFLCAAVRTVWQRAVQCGKGAVK